MTLRTVTLALAALLSGTAVAKRPPDLEPCNAGGTCIAPVGFANPCK